MKKVPAKLKAIRGTFRADRDGTGLNIEPIKNLPTAPAGFDKEQKQIWFEVCATLFAVGMLQIIGLKSIEIYCHQYRIYSEAVKDIEENGFSVELNQKYGTVRKKNPALDAMTASFTIMQNISDRFGFSPLSQSRIKSIGIKNDNNKGQEEDEFSNIGG